VRFSVARTKATYALPQEDGSIRQRMNRMFGLSRERPHGGAPKGAGCNKRLPLNSIILI